MNAADLVFVNASVLTIDPTRSIVSAVAVRNGRIVTVGADHDVAHLVGPRTRRLDLEGRTLLPSFQDAHVHPSSAGVKLMRCALYDLPPSQPYWACHDPQMDDYTIPFLPADRIRFQYPFASLLRAGAVLAGGSDWTVSTPNVLMEVETAVNRVSPEDRLASPFLPEEALEPMQALAAYTIGSAYVGRCAPRQQPI